MLFKNAKFFRLHPDFKYTVKQIPEALERHQFSSVASQEPASNGWFFVDDQPLISVDQHVLLQMRTERKLLPTTVINQVARERAKEKAAEQGYKVGRKQMKELKDDLYGYVKHGRIGLSAELNPKDMVFGDNKGWRLRQ